METPFDLPSAREAAAHGRIHEWVQAYLRTGSWANLGLADGLLLARRWWLGPFEAPLERFARKCGPEPDMEYVEPAEQWNRRIEAMASSIHRLESLPPLIAERRNNTWFLADGSHRHEALRGRGFKSCWALAWVNSEEEFAQEAARLPHNP